MELLEQLQSQESASVEHCLHSVLSTLWVLLLCVLVPPPLLCRVSAPTEGAPPGTSPPSLSLQPVESIQSCTLPRFPHNI